MLHGKPAAPLGRVQVGLQDDLLALLQSARTTLVFVTHSAEEAVFLGDRILVLTASPGRVRGVVENAASGARDSPAAAQVQRTVRELLGE